MRTRRKVIAPLILAIGTISSLAVGPSVAILSATAPVAAPVAASGSTPDVIFHM